MSRSARERYAHLRQSAWRHPKIRDVSKGARSLYFCSISYAIDLESDGNIPSSAVSLLDGTKREVAELVAANLWSTSGSGFVVVGYLNHNKSREEMESARVAMSKGGRRGGGSNRATREHPTLQGTLQPTMQGQSKVRARSEQVTETETETETSSSSGDDAEEVPTTLRQRVRGTLALTATPGTAHKLVEMLSDLHSDPESGRPYIQPGMCSAADRGIWAKVIESATRLGEEHKVTPMSVIAGEWAALIALAAAGELPRVGNVVAYFAKRFGSLRESAQECEAPSVPAREAA